MPQQMKLPNNIMQLKRDIIEKLGFSSQELNDEILLEMKKDFENINNIAVIEGRTRCDVSLNKTQEKFFDNIHAIYGITFTSLYIQGTIKVAKKNNIR
jgi:hypothetical protein